MPKIERGMRKSFRIKNKSINSIEIGSLFINRRTISGNDTLLIIKSAFMDLNLDFDPTNFTIKRSLDTGKLIRSHKFREPNSDELIAHYTAVSSIFLDILKQIYDNNKVYKRNIIVERSSKAKDSDLKFTYKGVSGYSSSEFVVVSCGALYGEENCKIMSNIHAYIVSFLGINGYNVE